MPDTRTLKEAAESGSDAPICSAFWESVAATAAVITKTLPLCGSISLVNESQTLRKELGRLVGIMERGSMPLVKIDLPNA